MAAVIFRGRVLSPDGEVRRAVTVENGMITGIAAIDELSPRDDGVELADDEVLLPGLVDTHVHVNEPGRTEWEGFATATAAAAAGGVTTLLDMPLNSIPATTSVAALAAKRTAADGQCAVDVGFWGGAVPENLGRLAELYEAGVFGFKCFLLDSGVPEFPPLSAAQLGQAMAEIAAFDGLLIVHAEDPNVIATHAGPGSRSARQGGTTPLGPPVMRRYADFLASRPPEAETAAIATVISAARATGCRTHLVHLSSADALPAITAARRDGVRLTVETCPHYLTLHAEEVADGRTEFKCCPPVREAANADRLWRALADEVIDTVVSDHSPCPPALKRLDVGDFGLAWGGIASVQLGLPVVWTEARARGISLATVVSWMAAGPADLVGLDRGRIAVGQPADLVVFAPDESFTVDPAALRHKNRTTPYAGRTLHGVVRSTYRRGQRLVDGDRPRGTLLTPT